MRGITEVRAAVRDDLADVARIHKARFGTHDYTLGQYSNSLIREFYASFLGRCLFLVHVSDRGIDGFVVGGMREDLFRVQRSFVLNNVGRCCLETLLHPRLWTAIYRAVRRIFALQPTQLVEFLTPDLPRLLSIAVDESAQGRGVAAALVTAFESSICNRYDGYTLSVLKTNQHAVRFYEKLGLTIMVDAYPRSFVFQKTFPPRDAGSSQEP